MNGQLDKVDKITDSAVDAADGVDTAARRESDLLDELREAGT